MGYISVQQMKLFIFFLIRDSQYLNTSKVTDNTFESTGGFGTGWAVVLPLGSLQEAPKFCAVGSDQWSWEWTRVWHITNWCYGNGARHLKQAKSEAFLSPHYDFISSTLSIHYDGKDKTESAMKVDITRVEIPNCSQCFQGLSCCQSFILFSLP